MDGGLLLSESVPVTPGYCVIWRGGKVTTFYRGGPDPWSLDPNDAKVYSTWAVAWVRSKVFAKAEVARCWT